MSPTDDPIATLTPAPLRRALSFSVLFALGVMLVYLAFTVPGAGVLTRAVLVVGGIGAIVLADKQRRATSLSIVMTATGLYESTGREICQLDDITGIDRGAFAFKPSNGFLIRTKSSGARAWAPGLWWRLGRRIGIGGVVPASQAKLMSDAITVRLAERS
jgi:hypothetical protein